MNDLARALLESPLERARIEAIADAVAERLAQRPPLELELIDIPKLAKETGLDEKYLKEQCRRYELGDPDGLRCTRKSPGVKNSTLLVGRDWFRQWRERQADLNQTEAFHPVKG
jgi:hypothetical protein